MKEFKGQVKISDIQAEFDRLVEAVNNSIDEYNELIQKSALLNLSKGSANLSNKGYTLSLGGLKTILRAFRNQVVGCNVFRNNTTLNITKGFIVKTNNTDGTINVIKLPAARISITNLTDAKKLYFNTDTSTYNTSGTGEFIRDLNCYRTNYINGDRFANTFNWVARGIPNWKYRVANTSTGYIGYQAPTNSTSSKFIRTWATTAEEGKGIALPTSGGRERDTYTACNFLGRRIGYWANGNYKQGRLWEGASPFYCPKGCASPFTEVGGDYNKQKWTNVIIKRS